MIKRLIQVVAALAVAATVSLFAHTDKSVASNGVTINRIHTDASFVDPSQNAKARGGWFVEMVQ
jgi:hypothetical protein